MVIVPALDIEGMTISTEGFDGAGERDRAAEADAGFLVGAFGADAEEVLEIGIFGGVGGENEDVVVALAEFGGDGELAFGDVEFGAELLEFLLADRGELDVAGVEFAEELTKCVVVGLGELGEFVVGSDVADFFGARFVMLALDGDGPAFAARHLDHAVAFRDAAGKCGDDGAAAIAVAGDDEFEAIELLRRVDLGILGFRLLAPQLERAGIDDLIEVAVDVDARGERWLTRGFFHGKFDFGWRIRN